MIILEQSFLLNRVLQNATYSLVVFLPHVSSGYIMVPSFVDFIYEEMGLRAKVNTFF